LLDCLDWVPNCGACIDACLLGDVTRSFRLYDIKAESITAFHARASAEKFPGGRGNEKRPKKKGKKD